jgi:hypothetical protein
VTQCKQCGVNLPEDARYCLQCGTPVQPEEPAPPTGPVAPLPELDFVQPALTGGMFLGLMSSIPFISAGNCLCCMWVLLGGGVAAVMLVKQRPTGITFGDAAFGGVLSGLFGAIVGTVVQMSFRAIAARFFASQQQQLEDLLRQFGAEGPMRDWTLRAFSGEISAATVLFTFFANLITYALFAMVGGILAIAILNKRKADAAKRIQPGG